MTHRRAVKRAAAIILVGSCWIGASSCVGDDPNLSGSVAEGGAPDTPADATPDGRGLGPVGMELEAGATEAGMDASTDSGVCNADAGLTVCGTRCVNLQTSLTDCGSCGHPCTNGTCSAGICTCSGNLINCGDGCVDLMTSAAHCGSCAGNCTGGTCSGGVCSCGSLVNCGDGCFDLNTSSRHCGTCAKSCTAGTCSGGACSCPAGGTICASHLCEDTTKSNTDCGMCGNACTAGQTCTASVCK